MLKNNIVFFLIIREIIKERFQESMFPSDKSRLFQLKFMSIKLINYFITNSLNLRRFLGNVIYDIDNEIVYMYKTE